MRKIQKNKMHKYIFTRGELNATKKWANELSAQYLPFLTKDKEGKEVKFLAQVQLKPLMMWEIVYPEKCEKDLMGMLKPIIMENKIVVKISNWVRKILQIEKTKSEWNPYLVPAGTGVSVIELGNKKDKVNWEEGEETDIFKQGLLPEENL